MKKIFVGKFWKFLRGLKKRSGCIRLALSYLFVKLHSYYDNSLACFKPIENIHRGKLGYQFFWRAKNTDEKQVDFPLLQG